MRKQPGEFFQQTLITIKAQGTAPRYSPEVQPQTIAPNYSPKLQHKILY